MQYTLSRTIVTDTSPVRALCATSETSPCLISGSEQGILSSIANINTCADINVNIQPGGDGTRHSHSITALTQLDGGGYVSGSKDFLIRIFSPNHELIHSLKGHSNVISSLDVLELPNGNDNGNGSSNQVLVSGSWDGTAKLWNIQSGTCLATLDGHENTVSVAALPPLDGVARLATGSAGLAQNNAIVNHKIRIYHVTGSATTKVTATLQHTVADDHGGPIRGLTFDPLSQNLLSCSNDGTVKVRNLDGTCHTTLASPNANPPMLLHVSTLDNGTICASGEDGSLTLWKGPGEMQMETEMQTQIIPHPSCVWMTAPLPGGNVATACHDGSIRIFTLDSNQFASTEEIDAFQALVDAAQARKASGPSAQEISKYPKWEICTTMPGTSEGQVQVFQKNGKAIAAQWSMVSKTWMEVGEVTGSSDAGTVNGVSFDHVFPIEIDTVSGQVQTLQIGYNNGDNPFVTAQTFIDEHMLNQGYLSQIANYIQQRVGEAGNVPTLGMGDGGVSSGPTPMEVTPTDLPPTYQHLPMKGYKAFETGADAKTLGKIVGKIQNGTVSLWTEEQMATTLDSLVSTLSATNRYHATKISNKELEMVLKMVTEWSLEQVYPALDMSRLMVLHPDAFQSNQQEYWNRMIEATLDKCEQVPNSSLEGISKVAVPMLALRLFANSFRGRGSSLAASSHMDR
jgi:phospholipase A-2-activating protein